MQEILNEDQISISEAKYEHDNGVSVRLKPHNGEWEVGGCTWPASWSDRNYAGNGFSVAETMDDDRLEALKHEAIADAKEVLGE